MRFPETDHNVVQIFELHQPGKYGALPEKSWHCFFSLFYRGAAVSHLQINPALHYCQYKSVLLPLNPAHFPAVPKSLSEHSAVHLPFSFLLSFVSEEVVPWMSGGTSRISPVLIFLMPAFLIH